jgi:hypothetical protein
VGERDADVILYNPETRELWCQESWFQLVTIGPPSYLTWIGTLSYTHFHFTRMRFIKLISRDKCDLHLHAQLEAMVYHTQTRPGSP